MDANPSSLISAPLSAGPVDYTLKEFPYTSPSSCAGACVDGPAKGVTLAGGFSQPPGCAEARGLSLAHIPPRPTATVTVARGGRYLKVKSLSYLEGKGGGKRGKVVGFSRGSRSRMMDRLACVQSGELPKFITLGLPDGVPYDNPSIKRHLDCVLKRLRRQFPECGGLWRVEYQPRKSGEDVGKWKPHVHLLVWGLPWSWKDEKSSQLHWTFELGKISSWDSVKWRAGCAEFLPQIIRPGVDVAPVELREWLSIVWYEIVGSENILHLRAGTRVEEIRSERGVAWYASKYVAKIQDAGEFESVGRCWGVFAPDNVPWAEVVDFLVDYEPHVGLLRLCRRYLAAQLRGKRKRKHRVWRRGSIKVFCDVDEWSRKLDVLKAAEVHE